jgi:hypothetical protein
MPAGEWFAPTVPSLIELLTPGVEDKVESEPVGVVIDAYNPSLLRFIPRNPPIQYGCGA